MASSDTMENWTVSEVSQFGKSSVLGLKLKHMLIRGFKIVKQPFSQGTSCNTSREWPERYRACISMWSLTRFSALFLPYAFCPWCPSASFTATLLLVVNWVINCSALILKVAVRFYLENFELEFPALILQLLILSSDILQLLASLESVVVVAYIERRCCPNCVIL